MRRTRLPLAVTLSLFMFATACDLEEAQPEGVVGLNGAFAGEADALADPVVLPGAEGTPILHNGAMRDPDVTLRWPDGSQANIYSSAGGAMAFSARTPVGSPYLAQINQARGVNNAADAFALLAPDQPLPHSLQVSTKRVADESREWTYTREAVEYLAAANLTTDDVEVELDEAYVEGMLPPATHQGSEGLIANTGNSENNHEVAYASDGCYYTDWFRNFVATRWPWPTNHLQTCWWHYSPNYLTQWRRGTNYGSYEFGVMNDHGNQMQVTTIVQEKHWPFSKHNWIFLRALNTGMADMFWVLNISGSTLGSCSITGSSGASHLSWDFY